MRNKLKSFQPINQLLPVKMCIKQYMDKLEIPVLDKESLSYTVVLFG